MLYLVLCVMLTIGGCITINVLRNLQDKEMKIWRKSCPWHPVGCLAFSTVVQFTDMSCLSVRCSYNAVVDGWVDSLWKEVLELHPLTPALHVIPHTTL